jgi:cellulose synthase operon protein C
MHVRSAVCLLFVLTSGFTFGDEAALKEARKRRLRGNYVEAMERYEKLAGDEKVGVEATIGVSRCLESQGEYDKALAAVEKLQEKKPKDVKLRARQAELLYLRGRWDDAMKAAEQAIEADAENFAARWVRAQLYRDKGETKKADAEFRWFVRTFSQRSDMDKDITNPDELLLVGLAGSENARWNRLSDQFEVILQDVYGDALKHDKDFWPAEYEAGMLLLEKFNRAEGLAALDKALTINPNAAEAMVGKGVAALQRFEMQDAERFAEQALKINPKLPDALRLRSDVYLAVGNLEKALKELQKASEVNPRDEHTLGRVAACLLMQSKEKELDDLLKEAAKHNPTPGVLHMVMADRLEDRRRYDEAEKHFKKAKELRPMLFQVTSSLGMLYMRLGMEKEGNELLRDAFKADPFNVRVSNTIKVLDHLEKYKTLTTKHFELRYDPANDKVLAEYLGDYLEKTYDELAAKFKHEPKGPILIEVFNSHQMFSGRTVALPDLHTIGACTGRMVAMVSPKGKGIRKPFNWSRVMRHELVHIFNLDQTRFLCPHWFTEGLAVISEGYERPATWNEMLRTRVQAGDVLNLDTIDLGFIRPRSPSEWQLAYCQAQLYVEYIEKTYGKDKIGDLLNAYRDGLDTVAALQKVCKVSKEDFEKGYKKHLAAVVKELGAATEGKPMTMEELKKAHEKDPDDADIAAKLAEMVVRRDRAEARKLAEKALAKTKGHPVASVMLARLETLGGNADRAKELLEAALDEAKPHAGVLKALGKLYYDAEEFKKAAELFEKGRQLEPYETAWLMELARVYARLEDGDKQIEILAKLVRTDADDLDSRKRLARLLSARDKHEEAERYAREALEIDITDPEPQEILVKSLERLKKKEEADRLRKLFAK